MSWLPVIITSLVIALVGMYALRDREREIVVPPPDTLRTGQPWLRAWDVIALTPVEIEAAQKARVPQSVTRRQARQALLLAGLLDNVQPAIDSIADPVQRSMAQIEWDDSQQFERKRPLLIALAAALGLGEEALDNLFIQAAQL